MCTVCQPTVRVYLKCPDCLSTVVVNTVKRAKHGYGPEFPALMQHKDNRYVGPKCGLCEAEMDIMGEVVQDKWVKTDLKCACDDRCTGARGPNCDCACGGKNHGTSLMVEYVSETGTVKVLESAAAAEIAKEFRAAKGECVQAYTNKYGWIQAKKAAGGWLEGSDYSYYCEATSVWARVKKASLGLVHKTRMKNLAALTAQLKGE